MAASFLPPLANAEQDEVDNGRRLSGDSQLVLVLLGIVALTLCFGFILGCRLVDLYQRRKSGQPAEENKPTVKDTSSSQSKPADIHEYQMTLWRHKNSEHFAVRTTPDREGEKSKKMIKPDEVVRVNKEHRGKDGRLYLQLATNSGGWVAETLPEVGTVFSLIQVSPPSAADGAATGPIWDWEWFRDGQWITFDSATCALLSRAEAKGLTAVELTGFDDKLVIDLVSMQQINMATNKRIAIRPCQQGSMTV